MYMLTYDCIYNCIYKYIYIVCIYIPLYLNLEMHSHLIWKNSQNLKKAYFEEWLIAANKPLPIIKLFHFLQNLSSMLCFIMLELRLQTTFLLH